MLIATYEMEGAILEIFDDYYCNRSKEEIASLQDKFSSTAQILIQRNQEKDYDDSITNKNGFVAPRK